jgi:hypothetical protein
MMSVKQPININDPIKGLIDNILICLLFYGLIEIYEEKKDNEIDGLKSKPSFHMNPIEGNFTSLTESFRVSNFCNNSPSESSEPPVSLFSSEVILPAPQTHFRATPIGLACYKANVPIEHCLYISSYLQEACCSMCLADDLHTFFLATPLQNDILPNYTKFFKIFNSLPPLRLGLNSCSFLDVLCINRHCRKMWG